MSAFLLGIGFRADMGTCARKLVLLKLIDACDDDGSRIFPAISTIARAAQCSTRQVQRELKAFLDIGLIRLVREGGKGPRSTNEYALNLEVLQLLGKGGWSLVANHQTQTKGDTVSPLDDAEKGDTGDMPRVTPETDKGDKLSHPTPPDSSIDPSLEPSNERERDDRRSVEKWLKRVHPNWPTFVADSGKTALAAAMALSPEEREQAADRMAEYLAAEKLNKGRCAFGVYLSEKRWERLGPKPDAPDKPAYAPAFGPVWAAIRMRDLVTGPKVEPTPLKGWELRAIAEGTLNRDALEKSNRMRSGWPMVNGLHYAAETRGIGIHSFGPVEEQLGKLCEFVPIGSECWQAWKLEHELRGWPWVPDPGTMRGMYFPAGGPGNLAAFEQAVRGNNDAGGREAAE
jgi:hypothetical protein